MNYASWERLASGNETISDARFIVHELSEIGDMESRGVNVVGPDSFKNNTERDAWRENFDKEYMTSHSKALYVENQYVGEQLQAIANVNMSPEEIAAVDPTSNESRDYMALPDGKILKNSPSLGALRAKGSEKTTITADAARRLGLTTTEPTFEQLVRAVKSAKLVP